MIVILKKISFNSFTLVTGSFFVLGFKPVIWLLCYSVLIHLKGDRIQNLIEPDLKRHIFTCHFHVHINSKQKSHVQKETYSRMQYTDIKGRGLVIFDVLETFLTKALLPSLVLHYLVNLATVYLTSLFLFLESFVIFKTGRLSHFCSRLTFSANFECFRCFSCAFEVGILLNTPGISRFSYLDRNMLGTLDCDAYFPWRKIVCMWGKVPLFICKSFGKPASPTGIRGESTSQPNARSALQCKQLNCKVTGVLTKARTSRAQSKA